MLAARFATDQSAGPHLEIGSVNVSLASIWFVGDLAVLVMWVLYSRVYAFLVSPTVSIVKPLIDASFIVLVLVAILLDSVTAPAVNRIRARLIRNWIKEDRARKIARYRQTTGASNEQATVRYEAWLSDFTKKHGPTALEGAARDEVWLRSNPLSRGVRWLGERLLTPLHSRLSVGLAPIVFDQRPSAMTLAPEASGQFGESTAALKSLLRDLPGMRHVTYELLPSALKVGGAVRAEWFRHLFHVDLLLWGRATAAGDAVTGFISSRQPSKSPSAFESSDNLHQNLFPYATDSLVDLRAVRFNPGDPIDMHIVLVACLLEALRARSDRPRRGVFSRWDEVGSTGAIKAAVEDHVVFTVFQLVPVEPSEPSVVPDAQTVVTDLTSRWAGAQLASSFGDPGGRWSSMGEQGFARQLQNLLKRCAEIVPSRAEVFYRLGAVSCLLSDRSTAVQAFAEAGRLASASGRLEPSAALASAQIALSDAAHGVTLENRIALARFAAHAAAAIHGGDSFACKQVREVLENSPIYTLATAGETMPLAIALTLEALNQSPA